MNRLWMLKNTVLEFFRRLTEPIWSRAYQKSVVVARFVLVITFIAVVISDLAECQPFSHYWQVLPDPGGRCRQGYANLLTTGVCNVLTDLLLVILPIPIIVTSQMQFTRKLQLVLLFSMSLLIVLVTLFRLPKVIEAHGSQQLRSLLASIEVLVATGVANALVLGSFVRDRGVKKRRFKYGSSAGESYHGTDSGNRSRRPTVAERAWGSDDDLFRDVGFGPRMGRRGAIEDLEGSAIPAKPLPAGPVTPLKDFNMQNWNFPERNVTQQKRRSLNVEEAPSTHGSKKVAFFDVGGLLDGESSGSPSTMRRPSTISSRGPRPPSLAVPAGAKGFRRGSQALLQDLGGLLGPFRSSSKNIEESKDEDREESGSSALELRELSPAISPKTEVPPAMSQETGKGASPEPSASQQEEDRRRSEPPPYEQPSGRNSASDRVGEVA